MFTVKIMQWFLFLVILLPVVVFGDVLLDPDVIKTSGDPVLSKWYGYRRYGEGPGDLAFSNALARAEAAYVPMLTVWSGPDCHYCDTFAEVMNSEDARKYVASNKVMFAYFKSDDVRSIGGKADLASIHAYLFITSKAIAPAWPYYRFRWVRDDGSVVDEVGSFKGIFNRETNLYDPFTLENFKKAMARLLDGYANDGSFDEGPGVFSVSDVSGSRLEAEAGVTASVYVPVRRTAPQGIVTNQTLAWTWKESRGTGTVAWGAENLLAFVDVPVPSAAEAGDEIRLALDNGAGDRVSSSCIHIVAPQPVSQENPCWIGERTVESLGWGEWTFDIDVATQKVAAASGAYTLVVAGGELWCPDCKGMRDNLLATDAFRAWAESNRVALVLADLPLNGASSPTMCGWEEYGSGASAVSGAGYLSRKGVSPEEAAAVAGRNHDLAYTVLNVPYENRARLWLPTAVLLTGDGRPCSKLLGDRRYPDNDDYPSDDKFPVSAYLRRFDEMLALAADEGEWHNNDWSTTTERIVPGGAPWTGTLSAVDGNSGDALRLKVIDVSAVDGVRRDDEMVFSVSGTEDARVELSLLAVSEDGADGVVEMTGPVFSLSSGTVWTVTNDVPAGTRLYLRLRGADDAFFACNRDTESVCGYSVSLSTALVCSEAAAERPVTAGELTVKVSAGGIYRLSGPSFTFGDGVFEPLGDGLYRACADGTAVITVVESGDLVYQLWRPGNVSFGLAEFSVSERAGAARLVLCRTDGSSGALRVRVFRKGGTAVGTADDAGKGRYTWPGDVYFEWPDGVATNQSYDIPVIARTPLWDGDQTVEFGVEVVEGYAVATEPSVCVLTITEEDRPVPGTILLLPPDGTRNGVVYARAGEELSFALVRTNGANGVVSAEISAGGGLEVSSPSVRWESNSADVLRTFTVAVAGSAPAGSSATVRFYPDGAKAYGGIDRFIVRFSGGIVPRCDGLETDGVVGVACTASTPVDDGGCTELCVEPVSGALPRGMTLSVSEGEVRVEGVPSSAGDYVSVWRIDGSRDGETVRGEALRVVLHVRPLSEACPPSASPGNGFPGGVFTAYSGFCAGTDGLAACLDLQARADGCMRLAVDGADGRLTLTSDRWTACDGTSLATVLTDGHGSELKLGWTASGFAGTLRFPDGSDVPVHIRPVRTAASRLDPGVYTIDCEPAYEGGESHGRISVTLRISAVSGRSARASYSCQMPDGTAFSGTGEFVTDADGSGWLPICRETGSARLRCVFRVAPRASLEMTSTNFNHVVGTPYPVVWERDGSETLRYTAGGGYCPVGLNHAAVCSESDLTTRYRVRIPWSALNDVYGLSAVPGDVYDATVVASDSRIRIEREPGFSPRVGFSFVPSTGSFFGTFPAVDSAGARRTVRFTGVALPNWGEACRLGCGGTPRPGPFKPFLSGTAYLSGERNVPGVAFSFVPVQVQE